MVLLYRSIWNADDLDGIKALDHEFRSWCTKKKNIDEALIPFRGSVEVSASVWLDVRRADTEAGSALRCVLREVDPQSRIWTTTATAMNTSGTQTFWVDVDCESGSESPSEIAAPVLVRQLLGLSRLPQSDGLDLSEKVELVTPESSEAYAKELTRSDRVLPIVTFSPDRRFGPETTDARARAAARRLVGVAQIYVLSPIAEFEVQKFLPKGFAVYGGAVRLYLPPLRIDDPADPTRHQYLSRQTIDKHPNIAASILARRIANSRVHPPVPDAWDSLQALLRRPTEQEVQSKVKELRQVVHGAERDGESLERELQETLELLAFADFENKELLEEQKRLKLIIQRLEDEHINDVADLEEANDEIALLRRNIALIAQSAAGDEPTTGEPRSLEVPVSIPDAIEVARRELRQIVIPESAERRLDVLEQGHKGRVWASVIWQGLLSLHEYAAAKKEGSFDKSFRDWCDQTGTWNIAKLAMVESATVSQDSYLREKRMFAVDQRVDPSGRIFMSAHLKIQIGGGNSIPRVYFYDDTAGPTGLVHVGFIGPHSEVPNTKS